MAESLGKLMEDRFLGTSTADLRVYLSSLWPKVREKYKLRDMQEMKMWMIKEFIGLYKDDRPVDEPTGKLHPKLYKQFLGEGHYLNLKELEESDRNAIFKQLMDKFGDKVSALGVDTDSIKISIVTDTVLDKVGVDFIVAFDYEGEEVCLYSDVTINKEKTDMTKETYLPVNIIQLQTQEQGGKTFPTLPDVGIEFYANKLFKNAEIKIKEIQRINEARKEAQKRVEQRSPIRMR